MTMSDENDEYVDDESNFAAFDPSDDYVDEDSNGAAEGTVETDRPQLFVAVIGVPGSGKSALAWEMATKYDLTVIDDYSRGLAEELDIAVGIDCTYIPNMMVAFEREKAEYRVQHDGQSTVTCGTLVESLAYSGLQLEFWGNKPETPETQNRIYKEMTAAQTLALMAQDCFRYHRVFYLPLPPFIEIPGQEDKYENWQRALDNAIELGIEKFNIPAIVLNGTLEQRMEAIVEYMTFAPSTS